MFKLEGKENKSTSIAFSYASAPEPSCEDLLWEIKQVPNEVTSSLAFGVSVDTKGALKSG